MAYRKLATTKLDLFMERMGSFHFAPGIRDYAGGPVDLTGSTIHMWVGKPTTDKPITVSFVQRNPNSGFTPSSGLLSFDLTEADLSALGLTPGNWPYEILCTNDGGVTTDKPVKGNIVIASWITDTF